MTANEMSGRVMIARYMREPIISLYVVFSVGIREMVETEGESGVRSTLNSMGVMASQAMAIWKRVRICST